MSAPARQMTIREVLQLRPVRRLWLAQIVSVFGDFLAIFAVLSYVSFNLHATAAQVTGISVAFMIPFALIGTLVIAREPVVPPKGSHPIKSVLNDLMVGVRFIFTHATISFVIMAMAAGMFAISCFGPLIAVYVRDELLANALWFGIINAMIGVGMIGGSVIMTKFAQKISKTHLALWGLLTMGAFVVVLAAFKSIAA